MRLIYTSREFRPLSEADLKRLVTRSRIRNEQDGLTGFLYYSAGTFLQMLEGEEATVNATFARIEDDYRHVIASILMRETITERFFENWSMETANPTKASKILRDFFQMDQDLDLTKLDADKALLLFEAFRGANKALRL
jgi:hypothetical protein